MKPIAVFVAIAYPVFAHSFDSAHYIALRVVGITENYQIVPLPSELTAAAPPLGPGESVYYNPAYIELVGVEDGFSCCR